MPDFEITTLDSGLRVISEHVPAVRSVALGLWIDVGSRDEAPAEAGLTHFIEHLLFKGTERHSALDIAQIFDRLGGDINAFTSKDSTCVHTRVLDEQVETALTVICDMLSAPAWAELEPEREVILEEIAMIEDDPSDLVHDLAARCVFGDHQLGRPIIGSARTVASFDEAAASSFHERRYGDASIVLAAAGNVDHEELVRHAEKQLALPQGKTAARTAPNGVQPSHAFFVKETEQVNVSLGAPGLARRDDRRFALALLDSVLGSSASSRLMQEIRERRGMAYSVYSYTSQFSDAGQVGVAFGTRAENVEACLTITRNQIDDLAKHGPTPEELVRAKDSLKGRLLLSLESTGSRMSRLGRSTLSGDEILSLDEVARRVDGVVHDDVVELAATLYAADRMSVAAIGSDASVLERALGRPVEHVAAVL